jgi:hypothetical protein
VCTSFIQRFGVLTRLSHTMTKLSWCVFVRRFIYRCCGSNGTRSPAHQHYLVWAVCCILEGDMRTILFVARSRLVCIRQSSGHWAVPTISINGGVPVGGSDGLRRAGHQRLCVRKCTVLPAEGCGISGAGWHRLSIDSRALA